MNAKRIPQSGAFEGPSTYSLGPAWRLMGRPPIFRSWLTGAISGIVHLLFVQSYVDSLSMPKVVWVLVV